MGEVKKLKEIKNGLFQNPRICVKFGIIGQNKKTTIWAQS
jgi:hypothetical protein